MLFTATRASVRSNESYPGRRRKSKGHTDFRSYDRCPAGRQAVRFQLTADRFQFRRGKFQRPRLTVSGQLAADNLPSASLAIVARPPLADSGQLAFHQSCYRDLPSTHFVPPRYGTVIEER